MKDISDNNAELVTAIFRAIERGDVKDFYKDISDRVITHVAGDGPLSGVYYGKLARFLPYQILAKLESFSWPAVDDADREKDSGLSPEDRPRPVGGAHPFMSLVCALANHEYAAVIYTYRHREADAMGAVVARIKDGKVVNVWHLDPTIDARRSFA